MVEDSLSETEFLRPTMVALADRIFKMSPKPEAHAVRVENVATECLGTLNPQKARRHRQVVITSTITSQELQSGARTQYSFEGVGVTFQVLR